MRHFDLPDAQIAMSDPTAAIEWLDKSEAGDSGMTNVVPQGFHPVADGGTIHERRHSLTSVLSPGVAWEDTDLST